MSPQIQKTVYEHEFPVNGLMWKVRVFEERWDDQDPREAAVRVALRPPPEAHSGGYETGGGYVDEEYYHKAQRERWKAAEAAKPPPPPPYKPKPEDVRVSAFKCSECDAIVHEWDGEPVYECSRCNQTQVGERQCPEDHIFMAKVANASCPECETGEEPEQVLAVVDPKGNLVEVS